MNNKILIVGAGFRGFCDALEMLKIKNTEVTVIDPAPFFGGLLHSLEVNDFYVDKGVHTFDSLPDELVEIITEICDGEVSNLGIEASSVFESKLTSGFSMPDLDSLSDESIKQKIKQELVQQSLVKDEDVVLKSLQDVFFFRYGPTAGKIFSDIFYHTYKVKPSDVEPETIGQTSLGRLKFLSDEKMLELKNSSAWLDSILAARRKSFGVDNGYPSIYPNNGKAMKGWCDKAKEWLENKGVKFLLGKKINKIEKVDGGVKVSIEDSASVYNKVIWANDNLAELEKVLGLNDSGISELWHGTPMLFYTLFTNREHIQGAQYLQNFDLEGESFRIASAGVFSNQEREGVSFITCECPTLVNSKDWENPELKVERVWREAKEYGFVSSSAELLQSNVIRIPSTFKVPKLGYFEKLESLIAQIGGVSQDIILRKTIPFFRKDIFNDSKELRDFL